MPKLSIKTNGVGRIVIKMAEKNKQSSTFSCKIITFVSTFYEIKPRKYGGLDKKLNSALLYVSQKSLHTLVKLHHKTDGAI